MSLAGCPGAERLRNSFPDEIPCACGEKVEMWPDEFEIRCPACGRKVERTVPPACIEWCSAARECVGDRLYEKYMEAREKECKENVHGKLAAAMRTYFGDDTKRIRHAERVTALAEGLLKTEDGHHGVVLAASILHDIGIPNAEKKHGSAAAIYQEKEGPPVAREIMKTIGIDKKVIDEVCDIIGHHHSPGEKENANFKIVYDADRLTNVLEKIDVTGKIPWRFEQGFLTRTGRETFHRLVQSGKNKRGGT